MIKHIVFGMLFCLLRVISCLYIGADYPCMESSVVLTEDKTLQDVTFDSFVLFSGNVNSRTHCASLCGSFNTCLSFNYNEVTKACTTHSVVFHHATDGTQQTGATYFKNAEYTDAACCTTTTSAPNGGGSNGEETCFPGDASLTLEDGRRLLMMNLRAGDRIKTLSDGRVIYTEVRTFLKRWPTYTGEYLSLSTETGSSLTLSGRHVVFVSPSNNTHDMEPRFAQSVERGEYLFTTGQCGVALCPSLVTDIQEVITEGAYVPLTAEGTLVVNDIYASCYSSIDHHIAHLFTTPFRWFPWLIRAWEDDGYPPIIHWMKNLGHTILPTSLQFQQSSFLKNRNELLNACSTVQRSGTQIRKKWNDYKSQVKKKAMDVRRESCKTGGGPAPVDLSDLEHKVVSVIPNCQIEGINRGLETEVDQVSVAIETVELPVPVCTVAEVDDACEAGLTSSILSVLPEEEASSVQQASTSLQQDNHRPKATETVNVRKKAMSRQQQRVSEKECHSDLLNTEKEKKSALTELLDVQKRILEVSERRLQVESERLALEREKFEFKKQVLNITDNKSISPVIKFLHEC